MHTAMTKPEPYIAYTISDPHAFMGAHQHYDRATPRRSGRSFGQYNKAAYLAVLGCNVLFATNPSRTQEAAQGILKSQWLETSDPFYNPTSRYIQLNSGPRINISTTGPGSLDRLRGIRLPMVIIEHHLFPDYTITGADEMDFVREACRLNAMTLKQLEDQRRKRP